MNGFFFFLFLLGPYVVLYSWTMKFWVRLIAGFVACSIVVAEIYSLMKPDIVYNDTSRRPFGFSNTWVTFVVSSGIVGGLLAGFSKSVGFVFLHACGALSLFTFILVVHEEFNPAMYIYQHHHKRLTVDEVAPIYANEPLFISFIAVVSVGIFLVTVVRCGRCWCPGRRVPLSGTLLKILSALCGAAFGSHSIVQAVYDVSDLPVQQCVMHAGCGANRTGNCCPTPDNVFLDCCGQPHWSGIEVSNRHVWCSEQGQCKVITAMFAAFLVLSVIGQFCLSGTEMELPRSHFQPASLRDPRARPDMYWAANLRTPKLTWLFLFCVLVMSSGFVIAAAATIDWEHSNFFIALLFVMTTSFTLWSIVEFFVLTMFFHFIRLVFDMPPLKRRNFSDGLPAQGRTILAYCLLSSQASASEECFAVALDAHLANLDINGRVTTSVVSVSSLLSVVQSELDCRDSCRRRIRETLLRELDIVLAVHEQMNGAVGDDLGQKLSERFALLEAGQSRVHFWHGFLRRALADDMAGNLRKEMTQRIEEECVAHFIYLHRRCKILKKPGQYQDLMVLASTGSNQAYTYLNSDYGELGRERDSLCFGFIGGNVQDKDEEGIIREADVGFEDAVQELERRGFEDVELLARLGASPADQFHYTMVLDSDTACPAGSIRQLVEVAEHPENARHGIINASLLHDFRSSERCTLHMWRSALVEVSKVNLLRGQYAIYDRVGFYGKGLVRNSMYINRVIGTPEQPCEALPIEILSHDTVEAKLMHPCVAVEVVLFEDVARNPVSALSQSTRWLLGEVRNACYSDGPYKFVVKTSQSFYSKVTTGRVKQFPWTRWSDVPCSIGAEYLSHIGFRGFHAGPAIMLLNLFGILATKEWGLAGEQLESGRSINTLFFVVFTLFIMPNAFMLLGYIPTLGFGEDFRAARATYGAHPAVDRRGSDLEQPLAAMSMETSGRDVTAHASSASANRTGACSCRRLLLILLEIVFSVVLYSPEQVEGFLRLIRAVWAQISGTANWVPQAKVEEEVERNLSLCYVSRKTWQVCVVGLAAWSSMIILGAWNPFWIVMATIWVLHPLLTYWLCMPFPESRKSTWMWTWVMELREAQNRQHER